MSTVTPLFDFGLHSLVLVLRCGCRYGCRSGHEGWQEGPRCAAHRDQVVSHDAWAIQWDYP